MVRYTDHISYAVAQLCAPKLNGTTELKRSETRQLGESCLVCPLFSQFRKNADFLPPAKLVLGGKKTNSEGGTVGANTWPQVFFMSCFCLFFFFLHICLKSGAGTE